MRHDLLGVVEDDERAPARSERAPDARHLLGGGSCAGAAEVERIRDDGDEVTRVLRFRKGHEVSAARERWRAMAKRGSSETCLTYAARSPKRNERPTLVHEHPDGRLELPLTADDRLSGERHSSSLAQGRSLAA